MATPEQSRLESPIEPRLIIPEATALFTQAELADAGFSSESLPLVDTIVRQAEQIDRLQTAIQELRHRNKALEIANIGLTADNLQLASQNRSLSHQKDLDRKTGLLNSEGFKERVVNFRSRGHRKAEGDTDFILFLDLDDFKAWNDHFTEHPQ